MTGRTAHKAVTINNADGIGEGAILPARKDVNRLWRQGFILRGIGIGGICSFNPLFMCSA